MTNDQLRSVLACLTDYRAYGETMRQYGRGYQPTGVFGESIDWVIDSVKDALARRSS